MADPEIAFVRLTEVDLGNVAALLNEPRNARHLPLAGDDAFTTETAAAWVAGKDRQWDEHGYGPWAVLIDGEFAGWGGFQAEENGADFALVLGPDFWGHGESVVCRALDLGFRELGLDEVLIALPHSRQPDRVVARYGFVPAGDVDYGGVRFRQYRLTEAAWSAGSHSSPLLWRPACP
ncbi:MAG TPA: GNAT family N-acetyltransferase [Microlunatus sp.]